MVDFFNVVSLYFRYLNLAAVKVVEGFDWNMVGRLYKAGLIDTHNERIRIRGPGSRRKLIGSYLHTWYSCQTINLWGLNMSVG